MSFFPKTFLHAVVGISKITGNDEIIIGTGFFYGDLAENGLYQIYLVTNRHVIENNSGELYISLKESNGEFKKLQIFTHDANDNSLFYFNSNESIDIAITALNASSIINDNLISSFYESDKNIYIKQELIENEIMEGDGIFMFGFPSSLTGNSHYKVVRKGIISRIEDYYDGNSKKFLIDSFSYPGNSGGPIFIKPEIYGIAEDGTKNNISKLIGIVSGYLPYQEKLISAQNGIIKQIIDQNSGLSIVEPIESLVDTINQYKLSLSFADL